MILKKNNNAVKNIVVVISFVCMFVLSNGVEGKESIAVDKEKNSTLSFDIEEALNLRRMQVERHDAIGAGAGALVGVA